MGNGIVSHIVQCLVRPDQKQTRFSEDVRLILLDRSGDVQTPMAHLTDGHSIPHSKVINIPLNPILESPLLRILRLSGSYQIARH